MSPAISSPHNLQVAGLKSKYDHDFKQQFQKLIDRLARPGSRPQFLAHIISTTTSTTTSPGGSTETRVAQVTIKFSNPGVEVKPFLINLFAAASADLLAAVSSHGLLGFSAVAGGDLEQPWRLVVLTMLDAQGVERMAQLAPAAAGLAALPDWLTVFECLVSVALLYSGAAATAVEACGGSDAAATGGFVISLFASNQAGLKDETTKAVKTLQVMASRFASTLGKNKEEQAAFVASRVEDILRLSGAACHTMEAMVEGAEMDAERSACLFHQLWEMTGLLSEAFRSSEYLIGVHRTHMYAHYGLSGGLLAAGAVAAARQLLAGGIKAVTQGAVAGAGVGTAISLYELRRGLGEKQRGDYYSRLLHLLRHMWMAAAELNTFLPKLQRGDDGVLAFRPGEQRHWEVYATNEVYKGAETDEGWEQSPAVIQYLRFRLWELQSLRLQIEPAPSRTGGSV